MKKSERFHRITLVLTAVMYGVSLVWFLVSYKGLDDEIGIHFDPQGFDVFASKKFGFYPFVAGGILTFLFQLFRALSGRLKPSPKISEKGNEEYRALIKVFADCYTLLVAVFFFSWNASVIRQDSYIHCKYIYNGLVTFAPLMAVALFVFDVVYRIKYRNKENKKK